MPNVINFPYFPPKANFSFSSSSCTSFRTVATPYNVRHVMKAGYLFNDYTFKSQPFYENG